VIALPLLVARGRAIRHITIGILQIFPADPGRGPGRALSVSSVAVHSTFHVASSALITLLRRRKMRLFTDIERLGLAGPSGSQVSSRSLLRSDRRQLPERLFSSDRSGRPPFHQDLTLANVIRHAYWTLGHSLTIRALATEHPVPHEWPSRQRIIPPRDPGPTSENSSLAWGFTVTPGPWANRRAGSRATSLGRSDYSTTPRKALCSWKTTVDTLTAYRAAMTTLITQYRGRVVDSPGDNLLAAFSSVVAAVQCPVSDH
jgi:hypothetical protein